MEKIIRWSCFTASACIVAAFLFALYISTLLPAVSYTHLDVYKRQHINRAAAPRHTLSCVFAYTY